MRLSPMSLKFRRRATTWNPMQAYCYFCRNSGSVEDKGEKPRKRFHEMAAEKGISAGYQGDSQDNSASVACLWTPFHQHCDSIFQRLHPTSVLFSSIQLLPPHRNLNKPPPSSPDNNSTQLGTKAASVIIPSRDNHNSRSRQGDSRRPTVRCGSHVPGGA
jgi:hypothetical protein